jgi:capsid protein
MKTENTDTQSDSEKVKGRMQRLVSLFECLAIMYGRKSKGQSMQIYTDKREKQTTYHIIKNDDDQNPIAEINKGTFDELRAKKVITGNVMHFAWRSEKRVHEFIG